MIIIKYDYDMFSMGCAEHNVLLWARTANIFVKLPAVWIYFPVSTTRVLDEKVKKREEHAACDKDSSPRRLIKWERAMKEKKK